MRVPWRLRAGIVGVALVACRSAAATPSSSAAAWEGSGDVADAVVDEAVVSSPVSGAPLPQDADVSSDQTAANPADTESLLPAGLVAVLVGSKADEWAREGEQVLKGDLEDSFALAKVRADCENATRTIVVSFSGHKAHMVAELRKICASPQMKTPSRTAICAQFVEGMVSYLSGSPDRNIHGNFADLCGDVYDKGVLQAAEDKQAADNAAQAQLKKEAAHQKRLRRRQRQADALRVLADAEETIQSSKQAAKQTGGSDSTDSKAVSQDIEDAEAQDDFTDDAASAADGSKIREEELREARHIADEHVEAQTTVKHLRGPREAGDATDGVEAVAVDTGADAQDEDAQATDVSEDTEAGATDAVADAGVSDEKPGDAPDPQDADEPASAALPTENVDGDVDDAIEPDSPDA